MNTAFDNPSSFFTASALNSRAASLGRLLGSISNAVQTLQSADEGITAITDLVNLAKSTALEARQLSATTLQTLAATVTGTGTLSPDVVATATGTTDIASETDFITNTAIASGDELNLEVDGDTHTITFGLNFIAGEVNDSTQLEAAIDAISGISASYNGSGQLVITRDDGVNSFEIRGDTDNAVSNVLGVTEQVYDPTNLLSQGISAGETLSITVGSASAQTITFGTDSGAGEVATLAQLDTAIGALTGLSTQSVNQTQGGISLTASSTSDSIVIAGDVDLAKFGLSAGTIDPETTQAPNPARESLRLEFNSLLTQIDQISADAGFNGVNLLAGADLNVIFNETGTSTMNVSGVSAGSNGLGISETSENGFDTDNEIDAALAELDAALGTLATQSSSYGSRLAVFQIRETFTENMQSLLTSGADELTLADINEESAFQLALETRYEIAAEALSVAAKSGQSVLRLFDG